MLYIDRTNVSKYRLNDQRFGQHLWKNSGLKRPLIFFETRSAGKTYAHLTIKNYSIALARNLIVSNYEPLKRGVRYIRGRAVANRHSDSEGGCIHTSLRRKFLSEFCSAVALKLVRLRSLYLRYTHSNHAVYGESFVFFFFLFYLFWKIIFLVFSKFVFRFSCLFLSHIFNNILIIRVHF